MSDVIPTNPAMPKQEWEVLTEDSGSDTLGILLYGGSGTGKTRLCAQFPSPLILACDPGTFGGAISARQFGPKIIVIRSYEQLLMTVQKLQGWLDRDIFRTLAIDSISYLQRTVMSGILARIGREIPRFDEWSLNAERLRNIINRIADLPCPVIFTATEQITKDEITGKIFGGPNLPGKLATELPQACDVVMRLYAHSSITPQGRKVSYRFHTVPDDIFFAKDRTGTLPADGEVSINLFSPLFSGYGNQEVIS